MRSGNDRLWYQVVDAAMLRATAKPAESVLPPWPTPEGSVAAGAERWAEWLRLAWADSMAVESVEIASPVLAARIEAVASGASVDAHRLRRMAISLARYMLRAGSRATPYGLFAGVAPAGFGTIPEARFGRRCRVRVRPDAQWLDAVVTALEQDPAVLTRLTVTVNTLCRAVGARLRIPAPATEDATGLAEASLRRTHAVALVLDAATSPVRCGDLSAKLTAQYPAAPPEKITWLIADLVAQRALISSLRAPTTVTDPLGHLFAQLDAHGVGDLPHLAPLVGALRDIHSRIQALGQMPAFGRSRRASRAAVVDRMREVAPVSGAPLAVDLRLDARVVLPTAVAREIETAATVLARLVAHPYGTAAWQDYTERFADRYGPGALVPVTELTDPIVGLGYPAGFPGSAPEPPTSFTARDEKLLAYAQRAALDGTTEIVLTDALIDDLQAGADPTRLRLPPHLELNVQVHAESLEDMARGAFRMRVLGVSRAAGTMTGRFLPLLESEDRARMAEVFMRLPTVDRDALAVQLSFPPLRTRADHVVRTPRVLPQVISVGEHPAQTHHQITLEDLAIGCTEDHRLYVAWLSRGRVVETLAPNSLNYRTAAHTPPLGRFLAEVSRASVSQITGFDWGVASALPFLPALRYGRTVLAPARWTLSREELPGVGAPTQQWVEALGAWRHRERVPTRVLLAEGDQELLLDLDQSCPVDLLRAHLGRTGRVTLIEAACLEDNEWIGGRAHSLVVPLSCTRTPAPPAAVRPAALVHPRNHGTTPAMSPWLEAELVAHRDVHDQVLVHLPALLAFFDLGTYWWFDRHDAPEPHLCLRVGLSSPDAFGPAAAALGSWADRLRSEGLLRDLRLSSRPTHAGRWGRGEALAEAERVFHADSRVVIAQLAAPHTVSMAAVAAANFAALACGFTGTLHDGMRWLADHARPAPDPAPLPRDLLAEAVRLANPADGFAALHAAVDDATVAAAWQERATALTAYRSVASEADGSCQDAILTGLLHGHAVRAFGIDADQERACLRLARAAALAYQHTTYQQTERG